MAQTTRLASFGPVSSSSPSQRLYITVSSNKQERKKKKPTNGPNGRVLHPFGPVFIVVALHVMYFVANYLYFIKTLDLVLKKQEKEKKNSPMAQTTRLASFGPVVIVPSLVMLVVGAAFVLRWCYVVTLVLFVPRSCYSCHVRATLVLFVLRSCSSCHVGATLVLFVTRVDAWLWWWEWREWREWWEWWYDASTDASSCFLE